MELLEIMKQRHSVRAYTDKVIPTDIKDSLVKLATRCNEESGLAIQVIFNDSKTFTGMLASYGKFDNVNNYVAIVAKKTKQNLIKAGYYGEKIVLKAQELGLNTCWVVSTYNKKNVKAIINDNEKLICVIALGYGINNGNASKSKNIEQVSNYTKDMPVWFKQGIEAALLAPTAINQQKFYFEYNNDKVSLKTKLGVSTAIDLGIVKYHFEVISNKEVEII
ncbi:nitroreductase family protein [Mycoplasma sp. P36-A1]|uniref:nitroreductase family protein n=1 Tax=Mycoplasma sp. P36-A1 TaxID=3252900 RepID=UPI003C30B5E9